MTGQIVIRSSPVVRRQPLLPRENRVSVGELAGGAAADCAVICCCCPCALMECLALAVYKLPVGICRWMMRNLLARRRKKKKALTSGGKGGGSSTIYCFDDGSEINAKDFEMIKVSVDGSPEAIDLDREMLERFHNTGFWRSSSQRHLSISTFSNEDLQLKNNLEIVGSDLGTKIF